MKAPRTKTQKTIQKEKGVTIQEFKAWLQGITEFHGDANWHPTKEQWEKIKKKLDDLIDDHLSGNFIPTHQPMKSSAPPAHSRDAGGDGLPVIQLLPTDGGPMQGGYEHPLPDPRPAAPRVQVGLMDNVTNVGAKSMQVPGEARSTGLAPQKTPENQEGFVSKFY